MKSFCAIYLLFTNDAGRLKLQLLEIERTREMQWLVRKKGQSLTLSHIFEEVGNHLIICACSQWIISIICYWGVFLMLGKCAVSF